MTEKETTRREGRILWGGIIVGIAIGLLFARHYSNSFLENQIWTLPLLCVGTGLIHSGITRFKTEERTKKNQVIFIIILCLLLAAVVTIKYSIK